MLCKCMDYTVSDFVPGLYHKCKLKKEITVH